MKTKTNRITVGALLLLTGLAAQAASYDLSYGPYSSESDKFSSKPFTDTYNFNLDGRPGILSGSLIEYKLSDFIDIAWAKESPAFTVYGAWDGAGPVLATFGDPAVPTGSFAIEDLKVPNQFSVVINGQAIGSGLSAFQPGLRGSYDLSMAAQPVPEPNTAAMLLAGVGFLGLMAWRNRQDQ